ncbi:MAG: hypothetical protein J0I29_07960 [Rhizobiales bacterium]|nr:hypothetical protein [Hyphomicrobiales bacterium]
MNLPASSAFSGGDYFSNIFADFGGVNMNRSILIPILFIASISSASAEGMQFEFNWQLRIGCDGPTVAFPIRNWPAEVNGKASLRPNRSTSMEVNMSGLGIPKGEIRWDGQLGRPTTTAGGVAELRVAGPQTLRATWRQPNNDIVMELTADKESCTMSVSARLHPGKPFYTLYNGRNYENCPEFRVVQTTCKAY